MSDRLEALQRLLQDPTGNTAALAVAIGVVVAVVLVVVLVLLALALPGAQEDSELGEESDESRSRRRVASRKARLTGAVVFAVFGVAALGVWYQSTSSTTYCTRVCHQMAEPAASWRTSAHSGIACTRCHEGRPWLSLPTGVVSRARSLYLYTAGAEGGNGHVPAERCIDCHTGLLDRDLTALNGEVYTHRKDFEAGRGCSTCHGAQGHVEPTKR